MNDFVKHLEYCSKVVATWPEWKRNILGGTMPNNQSKTPPMRSQPPNFGPFTKQQNPPPAPRNWTVTTIGTAKRLSKKSPLKSHTCGSTCGCNGIKSQSRPESHGMPIQHWRDELDKVLQYLAGDLNYNNRAKAKEVVKELLDLL